MSQPLHALMKVDNPFGRTTLSVSIRVNPSRLFVKRAVFAVSKLVNVYTAPGSVAAQDDVPSR